MSTLLHGGVARMKVKIELEIETDFYDEEIFQKKIESMITNKYLSDGMLGKDSKLIKFDMYIVEENK